MRLMWYTWRSLACSNNLEVRKEMTMSTPEEYSPSLSVLRNLLYIHLVESSLEPIVIDCLKGFLSLYFSFVGCFDSSAYFFSLLLLLSFLLCS